MHRYHRRARRSGFTLLEMLVALAIFTIVAVFAVGALVRITGLNRQAQTMQSSMNNLSFALEAMSREMRVGSNYYCTQTFDQTTWSASSIPGTPSYCQTNPTAAKTLIMFLSSKTDAFNTSCRLINAYWFIPSTINTGWSLQKAQQSTCGQTLNANSFSSIIDEGNMTLTDFEAGIYGGSQMPLKYGLAFIRLTGYSGTRVQDQNFFDVQTSVSERLHD